MIHIFMVSFSFSSYFKVAPPPSSFFQFSLDTFQLLSPVLIILLNNTLYFTTMIFTLTPACTFFSRYTDRLFHVQEFLFSNFLNRMENISYAPRLLSFLLSQVVHQPEICLSFLQINQSDNEFLFIIK